MKFLFFLLTFLTSSVLVFAQTVVSNKEWVENSGKVTTTIDQVNQNSGEGNLYRPIIELRYETPTEGSGNEGGNGPENFGREYDYYGIRNNRSTLQIVYGGQNGNYPHVLASFFSGGGMSVDGISSTGGNTFWNLSIFEDDIWAKNIKIGFGSNPLVQQYDFTVGLESQFTNLVYLEDLVHFEDRVWVKPNGKIGIGTASAPGTNDPGLRVDSESKFSGEVSFLNKVKLGATSISSPSPHDDYLISVDGKIVAREVIVTQLNWADYVFEENYNLMPLDEVEKFIQNNGHLPGVPDSKEVETNGISIGETNQLLLEKIEELTLYIIELEKKVSLANN